MSRGLYIGRFQPFHKGHLAAVKWILTREDELVIAIGSAQYSHTQRNPFTLGERIEMIWLTLRSEGLLDRVVIAGVPDTNGEHSIWVSVLRSRVPRFDRVYTNDPLSKRLFEEAGYAVSPIPFFSREEYEATKIREKIIRGEPWEHLVPGPVANYIKSIGGDVRLRKLFGEG